jgi:ABC-type transport system involved in multi-copper enzyme maturation permease subunit
VGEVDRGTADFTMTLPVTRFGIVVSQTVVWIAAGIVLLAFGLLGNLFGGQYVETVHRPAFARTLLVLVNLFCLYLAVGGLSWLFSAASNRRGQAMAAVFMLLLASFLLNFLAQFWDVAERLSFLGVMYYYRPLAILRDGSVPWADIGILLAIGGALWIAACVVFSKRDVCTV